MGERLDALEEAGLGLCPGPVVLVVGGLLFQAGEKALHRHVVPALANATPAVRDPVLDQEPLVLVTGILRSVWARAPQRTTTGPPLLPQW